MALEQEITTIQQLYYKNREEEKELWKPFNIEAEKLEKIVLDKFNEVIKEYNDKLSKEFKSLSDNI